MKDNNKHHSGITGYLTKGLYEKDMIDKDSVVYSFISFVFSSERSLLNEK